MGISSRTSEKRGAKRKQAHSTVKPHRGNIIEETGRGPMLLTDTEATANTASPFGDIKKKRKNIVTYFERGGQGKKLVSTNLTKEDKFSNTTGMPSKAIADSQHHRFGKVMSSVPCRKKPRLYTVSIAIPGSIVDNCQTKELKTCLVGQIARAATIYHVDEIVVYNDHLGSRRTTTTDTSTATSSPSCQFMAKILQYCECPQYLRKHFFPLDEDLQFVGILSPIDAPHHVRVNDRCKYREGIVLDKIGPTGGSCVNVGIGEKSKTVELMDQLVLTPGVRCTVQMTDFNSLEAHPEPNPENRSGKTHPRNQFIPVKVVSPRAPTLDDGTYWGYSVRIADSLQQVMENCPFEGENYDLKVGTSERGDTSLSKLVQNSKKVKKFPNFKHMIIVFGGISGIEEVSICTSFSCLFITFLQ